MSNPFSFKQFTVNQKNAAFKVGTDSVILGAWANLEKANSILDIGTGTGLLALMAAQRNTRAQITAIERDKPSYDDAMWNFLNSPWSNRLNLEYISMEEHSPQNRYDYIITNPPYFIGSLLSPHERKNDARHISSDWFAVLAEKVTLLSSKNGTFGAVLPTVSHDFLAKELSSKGWFLVRKQDVLPYPGGEKKRVLAEWKKEQHALDEPPALHVRDAKREYTSEYSRLTIDFYL